MSCRCRVAPNMMLSHAAVFARYVLHLAQGCNGCCCCRMVHIHSAVWLLWSSRHNSLCRRRQCQMMAFIHRILEAVVAVAGWCQPQYCMAAMPWSLQPWPLRLMECVEPPGSLCWSLCCCDALHLCTTAFTVNLNNRLTITRRSTFNSCSVLAFMRRFLSEHCSICKQLWL